MKVFLSFFIFLNIFNNINCGEVILYCNEYETLNYYDVPPLCNINNFVAKHEDIVVYNESYIYYEQYKRSMFVTFENSSTPFIPENIFQIMLNIESLSMSNVGIEIIHPNDFTKANNLRKLVLSCNKIKDLPLAVFRSAPILTEIDLSNNNLTELNANTFSGGEMILILIFSFNKIKNIHENVFSNLNNLTEIWLDNNKLEGISPSLFEKTTTLSIIKLNNNRIKELDGKVFVNLNELLELDLSSNLLNDFNSNSLNNELDSLAISENNLTEIILGDWKSFNATNNKISNLIISKNATYKTEMLILRGNSLKNTSEIFDKLTNLVHLDLTDTHIGHLNISTFQKLKKLEKLYLRNCSLADITYGTFGSQKNLKVFDISYNNLKYITFEKFRPYLKNVIEFYIDGNNLTEIDSFWDLDFPKLKKFGISNNHFRCSRITGFIQSLESKGIEMSLDSDPDTTNTTHVNGVTCKHNPKDDIIHPRRPINIIYNENQTNSQNLNLSSMAEILEWQQRYNVLLTQEQSHLFYLQFIKCFIVGILVIFLGITLYKFILFYKNRPNKIPFSVTYA